MTSPQANDSKPLKKNQPQALKVQAIRTELFQIEENLSAFVVRNLKTFFEGQNFSALLEGSVLVVTSKIVSLAENCRLPKTSLDKTSLVKQESDLYLGELAYGCHLTIKEGLLIPSAGIDESNSPEGDYLLYPKKPFASAQSLWLELRQAFGLKNFGVILSDSHTSPLRIGVTGIALAYWGFKPVRNMIGQADLFGHQLKMTQINIVDALACAAVLLMGEANEQRPLALLSGFELEFCEQNEPSEIRMDPALDLYAPLIQASLNSIPLEPPPGAAIGPEPQRIVLS